jgi:hypothetical protein
VYAGFRDNGFEFDQSASIMRTGNIRTEPSAFMKPPESSDDAGGLGALAGSRPSSEIDAYGGIV